MQKTLTLVILLLSGGTLLAQPPAKANLQKQRAAIHKQIENVTQSLRETRQDKRSSLDQLGQVQYKLQAHEQQLGQINQHIRVIEGNINRNGQAVSLLEKGLDTLKQEYARSIVSSYKNYSRYDFLNFVFSATSFNEALQRVAYLKAYRSYREQRLIGFHKSQDMLRQRIAGLSADHEKKMLALEEENRERAALAKEKQQKAAVVDRLKIKEGVLLKALADKKKQDALLANAITAAIHRNSKVLIKKTRLRPSKEAPAVVTHTGNFEKSKGELPWPLTGRVSMHFGLQQYSKSLTVDNPGITIETTAGAPVKAVFDGQVLDVTNIGSVQAVMLTHGGYITTYSNLSAVSVIKGQEINQGQVIGKVAEKDNGKGDIEFLISNNASHNFDPEKWLR